MKIVFISNYFNHHQKPLSDALYKLTDGNYRFISTAPVAQERVQMGWGEETAPYVLQYADPTAKCPNLIDNADVVIFGSAPYTVLKKRLRMKKLTMVYSERVYKKECPKWQIPLRAIKYYFKYGRHKNMYLLCAGAYTASDYAKTGTFRNRAYAWGYFPEFKTYNSLETLIDNKQQRSILWVARFLDWKHPEIPVKLAQMLDNEGYEFVINLIGTGELQEDISEMINANGLSNKIRLLGAMKPEDVRSHMEQAQIFLMTSDRNEGWGAVLNEAMNSGCAVVANRAAGATPMLIKHTGNGLIYDTEEQLYDFVKILLNDRLLCGQYGKEAYRTIKDVWNAEVAAKHLLRLIDHVQLQDPCEVFEEGPCKKEY